MSEEQPETSNTGEVEFPKFGQWLGYALLVAAVLSFTLLSFTGKLSELTGLEKNRLFAPALNLLWVVFPLHISNFLALEKWATNAHKVMGYLIKIQGAVFVVSLFSYKAGLPAGMFVILISLLICTGSVLWGVARFPVRTASWFGSWVLGIFLLTRLIF